MEKLNVINMEVFNRDMAYLQHMNGRINTNVNLLCYIHSITPTFVFIDGQHSSKSCQQFTG